MFSARRARGRPVYGVTLHTTGSGLPRNTAKTTNATLAEAARIYTRSGGPHYAVGWDGTIVATVADERIRGAHAGIESTLKRKYQDGSWVNSVSGPGLSMWRRRWPGARSPVDLVPTRKLSDINDLWIGIEMIPVTPGGSTFWAQPRGTTRFTQAQHDAVRRLVDDIGRRHNLPSGWKNTTRLIGHSDLNPITRDTASVPLWDPGYPYAFDMDYVRGSGRLVKFALGVGASVGLGYLAFKYVFK